MIIITKAQTQSDYQNIAKLATFIWSEHYTPIIGKAQVEYMLNKYQSASAIATQIKEGASYYILKHYDTIAGYFSYYDKEESLFLSKLYVSDALRGNGIGKAAMSFINTKAKELGYTSISLTVNKNNTGSIKAYEKLGFKNMKSLVTDIGNGYVMDDYLMQKRLDHR